MIPMSREWYAVSGGCTGSRQADTGGPGAALGIALNTARAMMTSGRCDRGIARHDCEHIAPMNARGARCHETVPPPSQQDQDRALFLTLWRASISISSWEYITPRFGRNHKNRKISHLKISYFCAHIKIVILASTQALMIVTDWTTLPKILRTHTHKQTNSKRYISGFPVGMWG